MKLAKILLILLIAGAIGIVILIIPQKNEDIQQPKNNELTIAPSRGDDPTYAEEVKQLTALTRSVTEQANIKDEEYKQKIRALEDQIQDAKRANDLSKKDDRRIAQLENQIEGLGQSFQSTLEQSLNPLKNTVSKLSNQQKENSGRFQSTLNGHIRITPIIEPALSQNEIIADELLLQPIPVYTLPSTSILSDTTTVTPLIGRVPNGGNVNDPFRFRLITGADNLMANGHRVPGVKQAFWSGYAFGVREESCVRGYIDTVTFIFEDGTIYTRKDNSGTPSQSSQLSESLGYIADAGGNQCITGTLVSNASAYLKDRSVAAFAEGLANAYASAQSTIDRNDNGNLSAFVDGETLKFGVGRGVARSASEAAAYLRQRQDNAFDVIYLPNNQTVQIMVEQQINIDYKPDGRKVNYSYAKNQTKQITLD